MRTVLILVALTGLAHANPAAEKVFQDGKALLAQGKIAEACEAFRRSQELEARVGTLLNLGDCEEQRGRFATAWGAFVDARALATRLGDGRSSLADQRAAALAPKLAYVTMKIPSTGRPAGLVVRRNDREVPDAELGLEVPSDPGHYEIEVSAPGFVAWKQSLDVAVGQRATLDIPALVADPNAPAPPAAVAAVSGPPPVTSHRIGIGAGIGFSSDSDVSFGGRVLLHLAPVGRATIRAVPSMFYSDLSLEDPSHEVKIYAVGIAVEYVSPIGPSFVLAAGVGLGLNFVDDNYAGNSRDPSGSARLSPTLRLGRSVDVGLHLQLVATTDDIVGLGTLGVDYFFY
ncbi:MAG: hypothetical protein H0T42_29085 [Deltaproteobacteria bacterium]|nr:hypothetical protein [Deltaproteobacteria bacterium]